MLNDEIFQAVLSEIKKIRQPDVGTSFFNNAGVNEAFMQEDLQRSALAPLHMYAYAPTFPQLKTDGSEACYIIPYFGLDGQPLLTPEGYSVFYRQRMKLPQFSKDSRYKQPSADQLIKYGLPSFLPYIHPLTLRLTNDTIYVCEGEKKTAAVLKYLGRPAFGIGGCQMWRDPNDSTGIHPWIRALLKERGFQKVVIIPDGDVFRYDISNAYGTLAHLLKGAGYDISIVNTKGKIDDLLAEWGSEAIDRFNELGSIAAEELVQSPAMLAKRYFLSYRSDKNGTITPHQNTSNISILLENHPGVEKLWLNLDTNRVHSGEKELIPQQTEVEITNYFQHNLGFDKINTGQLWQSLLALAKKNQKSPFFEWVKKQVWDGTPRLATWLNRLWGAPQNEFTAELGTKFLVASCARLDKPGTKVDWMMIVIGPQGTGKTSMPNVLFQGCSTILYGESNDKDFHMKLHSSLCTGFDEMDSFGKKEMTFLKAMISSNEDTFRPPYGRSMETLKRKFVLYGSGNREDFLQYDASGYRRYPIISITKKLEFEQLKNELSQMWAEAWHLYTTTDIDVSQVAGAGEAAEAHVVTSSLEEKMITAIDRMKDKNKPFMVTDLMMAMGIEERGTNSAITRELAGYLRKLGYTKKQTRTEAGPRYLWSKD